MVKVFNFTKNEGKNNILFLPSFFGVLKRGGIDSKMILLKNIKRYITNIY